VTEIIAVGYLMINNFLKNY